MQKKGSSPNKILSCRIIVIFKLYQLIVIYAGQTGRIEKLKDVSQMKRKLILVLNAFYGYYLF